MIQVQPTVFDAARAFLSIESMSNKKLQKLCYYAKAWYLALYDSNIINEPFEAWVHGPVNRDLYHCYKEYGFDAIPKYDDIPSIPLDLKEFALKIYESYGELDSYDLEVLSHKEAPWIEARGDKRPWESCDVVISEDTMKNYYRSIMV
jgi:uncharacterized phage-associated protein